MESFIEPEVREPEFKYDIVKYKALHESNQLQCFCGIPIKKSSAKADVCSCERCGFSVSIKAVQECLRHKVFIQWPFMQLPCCKTCHTVGIRAYGKTSKALCFVCSCDKPNYFRTNDKNDACWNMYIDVKAANEMNYDTVATKAVSTPVEVRKPLQDMF